jgi:prepilin-type N-terminal cleavage/methylation domain-containing protein
LRRPASSETHAFTLIELSIVLVIIGLIVGGVLVGQDLIRAAYVRAQVSQIEKFNTASNTFYGKYQGLPGDINNQTALKYGFAARGSAPGEGDGNGIVEASDELLGIGSPSGGTAIGGENTMFWVDLSSLTAGHLIEGGFITATPTTLYLYGNNSLWFPEAKVGANNFLYIWSAGGLNYYGLSNIITTAIQPGQMNTVPGLTVQQAYNIDKKVDDGFPQSGRTTAQYINWSIVDSGLVWADLNAGIDASGPPYTTALTGSKTSCYDNGGAAGAAQHYATEINHGAGLNCALSFQFQ